MNTRVLRLRFFVWRKRLKIRLLRWCAGLGAKPEPRRFSEWELEREQMRRDALTLEERAAEQEWRERLAA